MSKIKIGYKEALERGLTKVCTKCGFDGTVNFFPKNTHARYGTSAFCKVCGTAYYQKNKDRIKDNYHKFLQKNPQYYEEHKDKIKERQKQYNEKNKDRIKVKQKQWRRNNKEKKNHYMSNKYKTDPQYKISKLCRRRIGKAIHSQHTQVC